MTVILGLDPSLACTGWGVVRFEGSRLSHVANGQVPTDAAAPLPARLAALQAALAEVIERHRPDRAAVEEVFVNKNPQSTLKLAQARGAVLAACGAAYEGVGLPVAEHAARAVKKAVTGTGAAEKAQVQAMLGVLLPGAAIAGPDAADALAVAIADAHLAGSRAAVRAR